MLLNASLRLGTNALVAGALRHYDRDAAQSFFENSVGQEVGQYIGDYLGHEVEGLLKKPAPTPLAVAAARDDKEQGGSQNVLIYQQRNENGEYVDQYGNPAPRMYASLESEPYSVIIAI